ncbi:IS110 family transposase [Kribbella jejuensis]|uniref:Transposase n=2 Tax=Kribbella jejuensis TaxID=236068 RepID=A0A542DAW7_9ACTN|nr:IS110 family transposase [Kribbella jejuensis]TQJ00218.1 transposase [Kribbella jejuensis]
MTDPIGVTHFDITDIAGSGEVVGGVDTHLDTHTAACLDHLGRLLAHAQFPATNAGEKQLLTWLRGFGDLAVVGVEGTGSYGAGLARLLTSEHVRVVEVSRPNRQNRRRRGKSDPIDAEAAARAVLAGTATGTPKTRTGIVESIRVVRTTRSGAIKARTAAINTLRQLVTTAPEPLRGQLAGLTTDQLIHATSALRPTTDLTDPVQATKTALRRLARRCQHLTEEVTDADTQLRTLTHQAAPALLERCGLGPETAGQLLTTAGDNPHRLHSNAAFAAVCGASPVPVASGRTHRVRLNRGGDRQANTALHTIVLVRMRHHQPTRAYVARRRAEGKTTKEVIRCLKRNLCRELLPLITQALTTQT